MKRNLRSKLKNFYYHVFDKYGHLKKGIEVDNIWYGNDYGGFYVIPELVNANSIVYSFGIGKDISFDKELLDIHDCRIFGFDPTPKSIEWCRNQQLPKKFQFFEFGLAKKSGKVIFNLPVNKEHVSGSIVKQQNVSSSNTVEVEMKSFGDIVKELGHAKIDILKMDIEGTEYDVIEDILHSKVTINQILIEFHERFFDNGKKKTEMAIENLSLKGFKLFAISDSFQELSFVNAELL
jgi:FkbM family methyltransferase